MEIKLYDKLGNIVSYNIDKVMARGSHAKVYRISDNVCLKKFNILPYKYDTEMFKRFMELDLANFYKIYELYYNKKGKIDGYTMEYYQDSVDNIIDIPTEYILDNFSTILNSINRLSNEGIQVNDLIPINFIYGKDKITVIDIDNYKLKKDCDKGELTVKNELALLKVIHELLLANLVGYYGSDDNIGKYIRVTEDLFKSDKFSEISKKLVRYKYPIDYMIDKGKNC